MDGRDDKAAPAAVPEQQRQPAPGGSNSTAAGPSTQHVSFPQAESPTRPTPDDNFASLVQNQTLNANNGSMAVPAGPSMTELAGAEADAGQHPNGRAVTAEEIALYDRQIRLWGMQAQQKIQGANILLITLKALANEVAKNLVLAGVGSLTIVDDQVATEADLGAQFFLSSDAVGQNRAQAAVGQIQKLNPRVKVFADAGDIMTKGASYFSAFDVVIATDLNPTLMAFINTATRLHNRQFYAAGSHGLYGYIFCDLIEHDYVLKRDKGNVATSVGDESRTRSVTAVTEQKEGSKTIELVSKRELYSTWDLASETSLLPPEYLKSKRRLRAVTPALSCLRALWGFEQLHSRDPSRTSKQDIEFFTKAATQTHQLLSLPHDTLRPDFLRSFLQNIGGEIAPVTAILGGQLAQGVINALSQNQPPVQNMVVFDGNRMEANMYPLHPDGKLGRAQLELAGLPMGGGDGGGGGQNLGGQEVVVDPAAQMLPPPGAAMDHQANAAMQPGSSM
ncbi:hypothetical protein GGR56DRAFT_265136 [Xylariaceae sp. FL0804]|nr:hypothetical protein GGR56DRAFT_265136 [Xylariaceae sp. FL0804]